MFFPKFSYFLRRRTYVLILVLVNLDVGILNIKIDRTRELELSPGKDVQPHECFTTVSRYLFLALKLVKDSDVKDGYT